MVLHHVAHGAGLVVVPGPALDAEFLGHRDLDMVDMGGAPQRLEQRVGEAQRHQVLHRFLAEVVIDPVDRGFRKDAADTLVHRQGRSGSLADGLFENDAGAGRVEPMLADGLGDRHEEFRRGGEVVNHRVVRASLDQRLQLVPAFRTRSIGRNVENAIDEGLQRPVGLGRQVGHGFSRHFLVLGPGQGSARHADDAGQRRNLAREIPMQHGRQQLTTRKVAGGAEDDEREGIDGDDAARHRSALCSSDRFPASSAGTGRARTEGRSVMERARTAEQPDPLLAAMH